ncbi:MAG: hypothetical protein ACK5WI_01645, partial [Cyanobacteriota bacterium]
GNHSRLTAREARKGRETPRANARRWSKGALETGKGSELITLAESWILEEAASVSAALLFSLDGHFAAVPGLGWMRQWAEVLP